MSNIFDLVKKKQEQDKEKLAKEDFERLSGYTEKLIAWISTEGISVKDVLAVTHGLQSGIERVLQMKVQPSLNEWNDKSFKDFYASTEDKPATA